MALLFSNELEDEANCEAELPRELERLRQTVAAGKRELGLNVCERAGCVQSIDVVVAIHQLTPIHLWVAGETGRPGRRNQVCRNDELVIRSRGVLIEKVVTVAFDDDLAVFAEGAHFELMPQRQI